MTESLDQEAAARDALHARFPEAAELLDRYVDILASKGIGWGLLGPREGDKLWSRHVGNSLALVDVVPHGVDIADVGSGAGLPGLPLAIVRPDLHVILVEPLLRRATFLSETIDDLGLAGRVRVERARAEDSGLKVDVVTARAVSALKTLLGWTTPLFVPQGELLALKGSSAEREIGDAANILKRGGLAAEVLEVRVAPGVEGTRVVRVAKSS